jgi:hypothetical protein
MGAKKSIIEHRKLARQNKSDPELCHTHLLNELKRRDTPKQSDIQTPTSQSAPVMGSEYDTIT